MSREKVIVRTGIIGILANLFLSAFKAVIGIISGSIAITLDAVNNLSDALSSVITIIGAKLANKKPDKKHPYGHGRVEYISAMVIAVIVLYAGITSLVESVKKIINPEAPDYSAVGLIIIAAAVAVKIVLGLYVKKTGEQVKSDSLVASGKDALLDAVISTSTLAAAGIFMLWHVSLEAWLGAIISLVIIKAGVDMLREAYSSVLGERADKELAEDIKKTILGFEDVTGVYDLMLHNYGPDNYIGSVHIELPDTYTMTELDRLERKIAEKVYYENGVILGGIGVYAGSSDSCAQEVLRDIRKIVSAYRYVLQLHGFALHEEEKELRFDLVIDFAAGDRAEYFAKVVGDVQRRYPDYKLNVTLDSDFSG